MPLKRKANSSPLVSVKLQSAKVDRLPMSRPVLSKGNASFVPSKRKADNAVHFMHPPGLLVIGGCALDSLCVMSLPFPLWSYQIFVRPTEGPTGHKKTVKIRVAVWIKADVLLFAVGEFAAPEWPPRCSRCSACGGSRPHGHPRRRRTTARPPTKVGSQVQGHVLLDVFAVGRLIGVVKHHLGQLAVGLEIVVVANA